MLGETRTNWDINSIRKIKKVARLWVDMIIRKLVSGDSEGRDMDASQRIKEVENTTVPKGCTDQILCLKAVKAERWRLRGKRVGSGKGRKG